MPPKKTASDYEAEIKKLYPEVQLLKAYCESDPDDINTAKELEQKKATLRHYRDMWAERKEVIVYVDGREQLENTTAELRCQTVRTPQYDPKKWPWYSVGDYTAHIPGIGWYPVCRERKTLNDLDGTLRDKDHRKNLYEEFERFLADNRFTIFRFDLECTEDGFYDYLPPMPKTCKFCEVKRIKSESGDYFCPKTFTLFPSKELEPDFKCHDGFKEKTRDPVNIKTMRSLRKKIIKQCQELGMQIIWRGSREAAYEAYKPGIEEYLKLNYVKLLKLDAVPYNDAKYLSEKLSRLEAEMLATKAALGVEI